MVDRCQEAFDRGRQHEYQEGFQAGRQAGLVEAFHLFQEHFSKLRKELIDFKNEFQEVFQEFLNESQNESQDGFKDEGHEQFQERVKESVQETNQRSENVIFLPMGMQLNTIEIIERITPEVKVLRNF